MDESVEEADAMCACRLACGTCSSSPSPDVRFFGVMLWSSSSSLREEGVGTGLTDMEEVESVVDQVGVELPFVRREDEGEAHG